MITRYFKLEDAKEDSVFFFGARQTGKTTLLKQLFPRARYYDLLKSDEFERLSRRPYLLREELQDYPKGELVIIDEIQKLPILLDEVHWLMTNKELRFILTGSSARKLRRSGANLLGGRALLNNFYPLVSAELEDFDLDHAVNNGMIPRHYLIADASKRLSGYVGTYLQSEIIEEALVRNLPSFNRFLEAAALKSGEMLVYTNVASDCGVSAVTIKAYFEILVDTLFGYLIPAYTKVVKRKLVQAPKFYMFDVGVTNYLLHRS
nr:AAA family ATPase [Bacteroidales bacterium]